MNKTQMVREIYTVEEECLRPLWQFCVWRKVNKSRLTPVRIVENITVFIVTKKCCEGFTMTEARHCGPLCPKGCGHGR